MNAFYFIKHFVCPHCFSSPKRENSNKFDLPTTEFVCNCEKTKCISYKYSDSLLIDYSESLRVAIHVGANDTLFQLVEPNDEQPPPGMDFKPEVMLTYHFIPDFVKDSIQSTIVFLETLVTFS